MELFVPHEEGYEFKVIVTNKPSKAKAILLFHNGRASQENMFSELKDQCQMDCTMRDIKDIQKGMEFSMDQLFDELMSFDIRSLGYDFRRLSLSSRVRTRRAVGRPAGL